MATAPALIGDPKTDLPASDNRDQSADAPDLIRERLLGHAAALREIARLIDDDIAEIIAADWGAELKRSLPVLVRRVREHLSRALVLANRTGGPSAEEAHNFGLSAVSLHIDLAGIMLGMGRLHLTAGVPRANLQALDRSMSEMNILIGRAGGISRRLIRAAT